MMLSARLIVILALLFGTGLLTTNCNAEEDAAEGENGESAKEPEQEHKEVDPEAADQIAASPDAHTSFIFTNLRDGTASRDLIAGQIIKFLIGFANKGEKDFIVKHCETSFRYPMDYTYHIQNFSAVRYDRLVQPKQEATFDYAFIPSDAFIGRPLGLVVNLHYVDTDGNYFVSAVFNETMTIQEDEAGFNTEMYFLYIVLAGFVVVILLIGQHFFSKLTKGSSGSKGSGQSQSQKANKAYETGTNKNDVDFEWIPRSHLDKKSPKMGSPRNRKQAAAS